MLGILIASLMAASTFIYFAIYPIVAYFKDPKGTFKDTAVITAGLIMFEDFENTQI